MISSAIFYLKYFHNTFQAKVIYKDLWSKKQKRIKIYLVIELPVVFDQIQHSNSYVYTKWMSYNEIQFESLSYCIIVS